MHMCYKLSYTTWVLAVAYHKQLLGPKLTGVWARGISKKIGTPLFLVHNFGLGSSLPRNIFLDQNWLGLD